MIYDYQKIYEESSWYGNANVGRCPGVRLIPYYIDYLIAPVADLGCGRGHTVLALREKELDCKGYDQIDLGSKMVIADITKPIELTDFRSVVCIDVIEHLLDEDLEGLFENFRRVGRQAISINNSVSEYEGVDLHINKKNFEDWFSFIEKRGLVVARSIPIHENQVLYLTETKC